MNRNPAYRYAAVPVELPLAREPIVHIVRMQGKEEALKRVANAVDPDALIDVQNTRTFDTKHEAEAYAADKGWAIASLENAPSAPTLVANPTDLTLLKKKLLRG